MKKNSIATLAKVYFLFLGLAHGSDFIKPIPDTIAVDDAKAKLGKKLFFDTILSKDNTISCASCHDLQNGGDDGMRFSVGIGGQIGTVNAPTVYNAVFNFRQFWDGRARDLKEQAKGPVTNSLEMGHSLHGAADAVKKNESYRKRFEMIYPDGVTIENMADAIVEFEKSLITPNAPFDRYLKGDKQAISSSAKEGYKLFVSKGCIICHHGVNVGGNMYSKFCIYGDVESKNLGHYAVTHNEKDIYLFKVPSLRNVEKTAPYMHDGRVASLREAVEIMSLYQIGRAVEANEVDDIIAFLNSLNGDIPQIVD